MCSNIRLSRSMSIKAGSKATYSTFMESMFTKSGVFGFNGGFIYNVRSERLTFNNTKWLGEDLNRGLISIIGFSEGGQEFVLNNYEPMYAAILYNNKGEFAIMTENSSATVGQFHKRMPVLIGSDYTSMAAWFIEGRIRHLDPAALRRA